MKNKFILITALLIAGAMTTQAKFKLTNVHAEIALNFDGADWDLALADETNEVEYDPDTVDLFVEPGSKTTVPNNPLFSFLGAAGSDVWIVPQVINPNLLTVGLSAEEMPTGFFVNDAFELRVTGVSGPGAFALFQSDAFGMPHVFANTRDGLDAGDMVPMFAGFHGHFNWAFSAAGKYDVTFEAFGTLLDGTVVSSGPRTVTFSVSHRPRAFKAEL